MKKTLLLLLVFAFSCISPQKSFQNKRYDQAFSAAIHELKRDKSIEENTLILQLSLDEIIAKEMEKVTHFLNKDKAKYGKKVLQIYKKIKNKIEITRPYLNTAQVQIDTFNNRGNQLKKELYHIHFDRGDHYLNEAIETERKATAQKAYYEFRTAKKYSPSSQLELTTSLQQEAHRLGIVRYHVEVSASFNLIESWDINGRFRAIEREGDSFQKIEYDGIGGDFDCEMDISFSNLDFGITEDTDQEDFEKEIEDGYETVVDTSGNRTNITLYKTVRGTVITKKKIKTGTYEATADVSQVTNDCDLSSSTFSAVVTSEIEVTILEGDERAIPSEYKSFLHDEDFDSEGDMAEELIDDIYDQIVRYYF